MSVNGEFQRARSYMHAMLGVGASRGTLTEPVWPGTKWGAGYMWTEAAFYLGISLVSFAMSLGPV